MSCIFANSKYYQLAKADPSSIAPPIGYQFLSSKGKKAYQVLAAGEVQYKQISDKSHYKILSQKMSILLQKPQQILKICQLPRKNEYLSAQYLDFLRNACPKQLFLQISRNYVPNSKPQYSLVQLSQLISNPRIESLTHVQDYALSKFIFLSQGSNPYRIGYLHEFFNRRIIEYDIQAQLINHQNITKQQLQIKPNFATLYEPADIQDLQSVQNLIQAINETNKKKDPLYSGVHFYFADYSANNNDMDYFQREVAHYPLLQYYLTMLTGVLANGQSAAIKLCGAVKHKTFQYLFVLRMLFTGKVTITKPLGSNPFLPDSFITCQYYNKNFGDIIHKHLIQNYHLLKLHHDDKLLLDPKKILKQDMHSNLKSFNQTIVHKGLQSNIKSFQNNSNIQFYPSKQKLLQRPIKFAIDLQPIINQMIKTVKTQKYDQKQVKIQKQVQKQKQRQMQKQKSQQKQNQSCKKNDLKPNAKSSGPKGNILSGGMFARKKINN